ncbi:MAG: hypothetical protein ACOCRK_11390 [bacterium]
MSEKQAANMIGQLSKENNELREQRGCLLRVLGDLIDFCDGLDCNYHLKDTFLGDDYYQRYQTILEEAIKARDKVKGDTKRKGTTQ